MLFGRPPDVEALKRARDVAGLVKALAHRNASIAAAAAAALGEIGDSAAVEPLIEAFRRDGGPRLAAMRALGAFSGDKRILIPLVSGVLDQGSEMREEATGYLERFGDMQAVAGEVVRRVTVAQDAVLTYPHMAAKLGWDMLKTLTYVRQEAHHRALAIELLSHLIGVEAAQETIFPCECRCREIYDKSTDVFVSHVLYMPHDSGLVPALVAVAEDKNEAEDVRRFASLVREKLVMAGVQVPSRER